MACYKVTISVIDPKCGGEAGCSWKYTFYTRLNPDPGQPPTEGLSPKDQGRERALRNGMSDPLSIISENKTKKNVRGGFRQCKIKVKDFASNGNWKVSYDSDSNNDDSYVKPRTPYETTPPWGNIDVTYDSSYDTVGDGSCDEDFSAQTVDDSEAYNYFPDSSTNCDCPVSSNANLTDFPNLNMSGQFFHTQSTTTIKDFISYLETLQNDCLNSNGQKFIIQLSAPKSNIYIDPFVLPDDWSNYGDAQKNAFLDSKTTLLRQALGSRYTQLVTISAKCLKSSGTIINGCIYKQ